MWVNEIYVYLEGFKFVDYVDYFWVVDIGNVFFEGSFYY